jgi:hypothetical protein
MWADFLDIVKQYGPFPVGILLGLWIRGLTFREIKKSHLREIRAYDRTNKNLNKMILAQEKRIDKLHKKIKP